MTDEKKTSLDGVDPAGNEVRRPVDQDTKEAPPFDESGVGSEHPDMPGPGWTEPR